MLVLPLTDEDLVPDDVSAEQSGRFLRPLLQLLQAADVPAIDEDLRHRPAARYRAHDA